MNSRAKQARGTSPGVQVQILSKDSVGHYDPRAWMTEGDHLLESAKAMRALWMLRRKRLSTDRNKREGTHRAALLLKISGFPKASLLLLGYAVEMYLKAALAKAYVGCSEPMFDRDVRNRFGHHFPQIAEEIAFVSSQQDRNDLLTLKNLVLFGARYPVKGDNRRGYRELENARHTQAWDNKEFRRLCKLATRIKAHAQRIDRDSRRPASMKFLRIDSDGMLAFRAGGHLPPRITYRLSSAQQKAGLTSHTELRQLFAVPSLLEIALVWDQALIVEDTRKATVVHQQATKLRLDTE